MDTSNIKCCALLISERGKMSKKAHCKASMTDQHTCLSDGCFPGFAHLWQEAPQEVRVVQETGILHVHNFPNFIKVLTKTKITNDF